MKFRVALIFICICIPFVTIVELFGLIRPIQAAPPFNTTAKLTPDLTLALENKPQNEPIRFIIHFKEAANLRPLQTLSQPERGAAVVHQLQLTANSAQETTLAQLEQEQKEGIIISYRQLWIINAISVVGHPEAVTWLAAQPQIEKIDLDAIITSFNQGVEAFDIESFEIAAQPVTTTLKNWGLPHMRVPETWHGLNVDGAGVVVGIVDSGVDYRHPDLAQNYRGNLGNGIFDHTSSWYYADDPLSITVPTDTIGHGTHVAGIAVGQNGIGVAPAAQWIGVSIADSSGLLLESNIQAGLQWLLAPNGDPNLAPDIINGSWGDSENTTVFREAIEAIAAAGILPVFATGNSGPAAGSIGAPASYPETLAVGAHDDANTLAWFSSQGPSPFFEAVQPLLVAPGTAVLSAFPNNRYATATGTSMATPQVSGAAALLLATNPGLSHDAIFELLMETAVPLTETHPNMGSGWGRLDVYSLISQEAPTGQLQGQLSDQNGPIAHGKIEIETAAGYSLSFETDASGTYQISLAPGVYSLTVNRFGYQTADHNHIVIYLNQNTVQNVVLTRLPYSTLSGQIRSAADGMPLAGVRITLSNEAGENTESDSSGRFQLVLPEGQYKLSFERLGYAYHQQAIFSQAQQDQTYNLTLAEIPTLLLVDAGQWHFGSKISYYQTSLHDSHQSFDTHTIRNPFTDVPTYETLAQYDTVIWSDPIRSPGILNATSAITGFLEAGGNLVLSGQNIGLFDSSLYGTVWWYGYLEANYLDHRVITQPIAGAAQTPFSGFVLGLNGIGSAQNQFAVDSATPQPNSFTIPLFHYANGDPAALGISQCKPYQLVYFGFGLEGVTYPVVRSQVMERLFAYLDEPDELVGNRWLNEDQFDFGIPGEAYTYTLSIQNMSEEYTDTVHIELDNARWSTSLSKTTLTLGPCQSAETTLTIRVPEDEPKNSFHETAVTAVSSLNPTHKPSLHFEHKTPGNILLVDDDRWYQQEALFQNVLNANGLTPDIWNTSLHLGNNSPSLTFLNQYDFVVWYTGFDWFQPVTNQERDTIQAYLDQGGRLFLSSQDFMYYHHQTALAQDYFGAIGYRESVSPTALFGGNTPGFSASLAGPLLLNYDNYVNYSDGLLPSADSQVLFWHNAGLPAAIGHEGQNFRTVLMSVPFEKLPPESHAEVMNQMVGWISDIGGSSLTVNNRSAQPGIPRTYTLTVQNSASAPPNQVTVTNVLPSDLSLNLASLTGGATYNASSHTVSWFGVLESGQRQQIVYEATPSVSLASGTAVENKATFAYARHLVQFDSYATTWITPPDLQNSSVTLATNRPIVPDRITFTLWITNSGLAATDGVSAVLYLPDRIYPLTSTLNAAFGTAAFTAEQLSWRGDLAPGESVSASLAFSRSVGAITHHIFTAISVQDGVTAAIVHPFEAFIHPYRYFYPIFSKAANN